ncbi:MAG TPA: Mur ligase domain-containing protein, partial [Anaerolineae bacterium]|nr:Mur ligase domain-containing protein [Anaerolineae bacterium]
MMSQGVLTLEHLMRGLTVPTDQSPSGALAQIQIRSAVIDSRLSSPDCLFIALRGERQDGHDFIGQAID